MAKDHKLNIVKNDLGHYGSHGLTYNIAKHKEINQLTVINISRGVKSLLFVMRKYLK